jgi:hypothetical protein
MVKIVRCCLFYVDAVVIFFISLILCRITFFATRITCT